MILPVFASAWQKKMGSLTDRVSVQGIMYWGLLLPGLHSNGYSLARKVVFEKAGFEKETYVESLNQTAGEALLQPTRIYVRAVRSILSHYRVKHVVHGIAHITGGGLFENLERILPLDKHAQITRESWPIPPVFNWIQELGEIDEEEMERVFNMGLGLGFGG